MDKGTPIKIHLGIPAVAGGDDFSAFHENILV